MAARVAPVAYANGHIETVNSNPQVIIAVHRIFQSARSRSKTTGLGLAISLLSACSSQPQVPFSYSLAPLSFEPGNTYNVSDGRARFREIFCAANEDHGESLPDFRPCDDALVRFEDEPPPTGEPVSLGVSSAGLMGKMVPGLAYSCIKPWLHHDNSAPNHVATLGYETGFIQVEGIASSETNATLIADYIASLGPEHTERPLILFGYSKGVPDIFAFLAAYPELTAQVAAVVSYAGAVWGSPLADTANEKQLRWLTYIPGAECEKQDSKALETLSPANRKAWFADNTLPEHIRYYSVIAFPDPENISNGLQRFHRKLGELKDGRNDSQVVFYDQVIPGSTILGFFNADHWAMSVPIARQHEITQAVFADQNDFPREIALEAILRYIEEDLEKAGKRPDAP
ncbi:MAG: hypothetical protein VW317_07905 [Halieaceae bacterium]